MFRGGCTLRQMIRIEREDYERRVVEALREELIEENPKLEHRGNRIKVEDVKVDRSGPEHFVYIFFREETRPECLFGFHTDPVEWDTNPLAETIVLDPSEGCWGPEEWAGQILATGFKEQILAFGHGLPSECDPERVTWITGYREGPYD